MTVLIASVQTQYTILDSASAEPPRGFQSRFLSLQVNCTIAIVTESEMRILALSLQPKPSIFTLFKCGLIKFL